MVSHIVVNILIIQNNTILLESIRGGGWKIPGGHVENGESPVDTAKREAREELGIEIKFTNIKKLFPDDEIARCLPTPFASFAHTVEKDGSLAEKHVNVMYAYTVEPVEQPNPQEGQEIQWFGLDDISKLNNPYVKELARAALRQQA